jgi:HicB-like protein involved in pilus formation
MVVIFNIVCNLKSFRVILCGGRRALEMKKTMTFQIEKELHKRLKIEAADQGITLREYMEFIIVTRPKRKSSLQNGNLTERKGEKQ